MEGKLGWFESVRTLACTRGHFSGHLEELRSMPSLRSLQLPSCYAERAVDATALCTLTGLTSLAMGEEVEEEEGEGVLELGGFTMRSPLFNSSAAP
jgi:hypothetical protein